MKIGVLSDSHSKLDFIYRAISLFRNQDIGILIHCGDLDTPNILEELAVFPRVYVVKGNDDKLVEEYKKISCELGIKFYKDYADLNIEGKTIAVLHGDNYERYGSLITSGQYNYILYGHTHQPTHNKYKSTNLVNPGSWNTKKVAIIDLEKDSVEHFNI